MAVVHAPVVADLGVWGVPFEEVEFRLFGPSAENCTGREFAVFHGGWKESTTTEG
jgi:hypothetical protein